jgi:hypothetical protein
LSYLIHASRAFYLSAVEDAFGAGIDYAILQKIYGNSEQGPETRLQPGPSLMKSCRHFRGTYPTTAATLLRKKEITFF